ncbi:MAG: HAMP domain-containing sensor histidine kinase [Chloroflexota bacterium]
MTLRTRLALWYSGLLMAVIIIFSIAVITVSRVTLLQTVDQVLSSTVTSIVDSIDPLPVDGFELDGDLEIFFRRDDVFHVSGVSVQVWQIHTIDEPLDEPILVRSSSDLLDSTTSLDPNNLHVNKQVINSVMVSDRPERVLTQPFSLDDGTIIGVIQVSAPLTAIADANDQLLVITLISALICIGVSIGLGKWLSTHLLKPVDAIKEAAASVAVANDLTNRINWEGPDDELGALTKSFNHMMERLEGVFKLQQDFIGDVSHELRTPLTSIIGHLEIMDKYGVDNDSLDALHREANRMSRMVNDLLLLTRADSGEMKIDRYAIDVDAVMLEVFEQSLALVKERHLSINLERLEPVRIHGNADRLKQLLLNLISNAIKFTTDEGQIYLSVYPQGEQAIIEIRDTGIGIDEKDLPRIFDRFFQADSARVHRSDADGAGLGLSIVKWIVETHEGTIDVKSRIGQGTTFTITFPAVRVID